MKMKKVSLSSLALICLVILMLLLVACGDDGPGTDVILTGPISTTVSPHSATTEKYQLIISYDAQKGTVSGTGVYESRASVSVTAAPKVGYTFIGWYNEQNAKLTGEEIYTFKMPDKALTLKAEFSAAKYPLTVNCNAAKGSVMGAGTYEGGASVPLTAVAKDGFTFVGWYNEENEFLSSNAAYTLTMPQKALTVKAEFTTEKFPLSVSFDEDMGTVEGIGSYEENMSVSLKAIANTGYAFIGWYDDANALLGYDETYTLSMPGQGVTLTAKFIVDDDPSSVLLYTLSSTGLSYTVSGVKSSCPSDVTISATYRSLPVTTIAAGCFADRTDIRSIVIPDGVTGIAKEAFKNCRALVSLTIPGSVTNIGISAFSGCTSLESLTLPFVGSALTAVEDSSNRHTLGILFGTEEYDGSVATVQNQVTYFLPAALKTVTVTGGKISGNAFGGCRSVEKVALIKNVQYIAANAFYQSTIKEIVCESVQTINCGAFAGCEGLVSLTVPFIGDTLKKSTENNRYPLGYFFGKESYTGAVSTMQHYYADSNSPKATAVYYLPSTLKNVTVTGGIVSFGAFRNCTSLESVTLPTELAEISETAFFGCTSLVSLTVPETVKTIGANAFYGSGLSSISLPASVTDIGDFAFSACENLQSVKFAGNAVRFGVGMFSGCTALRAAPANLTSIGEFMFRGCITLTEVNIENGITEIGTSAFSGCHELTSVSFPDSVISIGEDAFSGCIKLTGLHISCGITEIGNDAFRGCVGLSSIIVEAGNSTYTAVSDCLIETATKTLVLGCKTSVLPNDGSVTEIGTSAFAGCTALTAFIIPDCITAIGDSAFSGCSELTSVAFSDHITTVSNHAFRNCEKLTSVTFGSEITRIGNGAFANCKALTGISVPANVLSIGEEAFSNCEALLSVTLAEGISEIGAKAFADCILLKNVTLPNTVTVLSEGMFQNCVSLKGIGLGNGVITIGDDAFRACTVLASVTFPETLTSIGSYAFYECRSLAAVTIPASMTRMGRYVFYDCDNLKNITFANATRKWYKTVDPTNWVTGKMGSVTTVADSAVMATEMVYTYPSYYWYK